MGGKRAADHEPGLEFAPSFVRGIFMSKLIPLFLVLSLVFPQSLFADTVASANHDARLEISKLDRDMILVWQHT